MSLLRKPLETSTSASISRAVRLDCATRPASLQFRGQRVSRLPSIQQSRECQNHFDTPDSPASAPPFSLKAKKLQPLMAWNLGCVLSR